MVVTRFIADMLYEERHEAVLPVLLGFDRADCLLAGGDAVRDFSDVFRRHI